MTIKACISILWVILLSPMSLVGQEFPLAKPKEVGLSPTDAKRIFGFIAELVDKRDHPNLLGWRLTIGPVCYRKGTTSKLTYI
jgi:hypothetical protein